MADPSYYPYLALLAGLMALPAVYFSDLCRIRRILHSIQHAGVSAVNFKARLTIPATSIGRALAIDIYSLIERIRFLENNAVHSSIAANNRTGSKMQISHAFDNSRFLASINKLAAEKMKVQAELRITEEKERSSEFMLSVLSHDMRSPLNNIQIALKIIDSESSDEKVKRLIEISLKNCGNLQSQILEIIDYIRHESNAVMANAACINLNPVIDQVIDSLSIDAQNSNCSLKNHGNHNATALVDPKHLQRIIYNIIGNSIKYSANGCVTIDTLTSKDAVQIVISDTGHGMGKNKLQQLFQPFISSDQNNPGSIGLGLYLTKKLVEINKGKIEVDSVIGKGSTFTISFPAAVHQAQQSFEPISESLLPAEKPPSPHAGW